MRYPQYVHTNRELDITDHIKWCRANLGARGRDWDFSGNTNTVHIWINEHSPKYTFYELKYGAVHQRR